MRFFLVLGLALFADWLSERRERRPDSVTTDKPVVEQRPDGLAYITFRQP